MRKILLEQVFHDIPTTSGALIHALQKVFDLNEYNNLSNEPALIEPIKWWKQKISMGLFSVGFDRRSM